MLFVSFIALYFGVALAIPTIPNRTNYTRDCSSLSPADIEAAEAHFEANKVLTTNANTESTAIIPVYWHVIRAGTALTQGNIPDSQIKDAVKVLNEDYRLTGLQFKLEKINRVNNAKWFDYMYRKSTDETEMKQALHQGNATALNVYTVGFSKAPGFGSNSIAFSYMPFFYAKEPKQDGVVMLYSTVPGGTEAYYNRGRILTHEVGHWAGLYHTFEGGCTPKNDRVHDTPWQNEPTYACPTGKSSCGGPDLINNFMDYTDDICMDSFTPGQIARMKFQVATYRGISV
ncbi:extracellular metalloprotease [Rhizoctonia solani 123E]|uniref:Extracellular metalloprotease n=1 Tax=Rhizoctonia solani 123E TaxID=1423351 RepID=A0A074RHH8_9AGAM|nr:extracellular metalloprotease [Rhizoctonia solani 123E]